MRAGIEAGMNLIGTAERYGDGAAEVLVAFPSGSGECALMFAVTGHNPIKLLRYTVPYLIIAILALTFSVNLFFPVF